jgi:nucleotide-binding universal stress UspA family protein
MKRGFVTLGGTESSGQLLREAAEHATGADASLIVFSPFTRGEIDHDLEVLDRIAGGESSQAGEQVGEDLAAEIGERLARELLREFDVEYQVVGAIVDDHLGRYIVSEAAEYECDHIFVTSKRRSRVGSAVGDTARTILRDFDGITTIARERDPERRLARLRGRSIDDYDLNLSSSYF